VRRAVPLTLDLRAATSGDANAMADVYLGSRRELVACAPLVHSPTRPFALGSASASSPPGARRFAVVEGRVIGLLAVSTGADASWIEQLYVLPTWVGTRLLDFARRRLPAPIRLYTFQSNDRARRFYESRGFRAIDFGDGSANEEKCPDILYEWRPDTEAPVPPKGG
jgi:GNAT superfamily N-acetyltransferase